MCVSVGECVMGVCVVGGERRGGEGGEVGSRFQMRAD